MLENENVTTDTKTVEIILASASRKYPFQLLDISMDSSPEEILGRLGPVVREDAGVDIFDESGDSLYVVKKMSEEEKIFVYPKGTAG